MFLVAITPDDPSGPGAAQSIGNTKVMGHPSDARQANAFPFISSSYKMEHLFLELSFLQWAK